MYQVSFEENSNYLKSFLKGERKVTHRTDGAVFWLKMAEYCNQNNIQNLLVISELTGPIDMLSEYDISRTLKEMGLSIIKKIAFVETNIEAFKIYSFVTKYSKGVNIQVFDNLPDAIYWLE